MPSNIDKKFIENLQDFTESLENVVELMKQQSEKGGDAVNKMLSALDGPKLSEISEDIKAILDTNKKIDNRTKEILEEIKASKKQKETGMFDKISNKENKHKIRDSIQTIILISGGVLAIGMAFKIIGKVDFLSVISLSLAMLTMSYTFSEISKIEGLTTKKVLMAGLAIVAMATAITISSFILKKFQPLDPITMFSFVLVSVGLGMAAMFIFKAVKDLSIKPKDMAKYLLLPLILPAMALGIALSSYALQYVAPVGIMQMISAVFTGLALVAAAFAVKMVMMAIGKLDSPKDLLKVGLAVLMLPILAGGILVSSYILSQVVLISNPFQLALTSLAIGISMLAFAPTVYILGKMKISQMAKGALGAVIVSVAIMASSWIISVGKYDGAYPSAKWALGVGLSLLLFTPAILVIGIIAMTGIGALAILAGAGLTLVVAASIVGVSHILSRGMYDSYPGAKWAAGVGLSLIIFAPALLLLGVIPFGEKILTRGAKLMFMISATIVAVGAILSKGTFKGGPTVEWAEGIGAALNVFANAVGTGKRKSKNLSESMVRISESMVYVSLILTKGDWVNGKIPKDWMENIYKNYIIYTQLYNVITGGKLLKTLIMNTQMKNIAGNMVEITHILKMGVWDEGKIPSEWMMNISANYIAMVNLYGYIDKKDINLRKFNNTMKSIARSMVETDKILNEGNFSNAPGSDWADSISKSMNAFTDSIVGVDDKKLKALKDFSKVIRHLSRSLRKLKDSGLEKLGKLTTSVTIMSVIDESKLNSVIKVLDDNKDKLSSVVDSRGLPGGSIKQKVGGMVDKLSGKVGASKAEAKQDEMMKKFDSVLEKFDQLLEYVVEEKSPSDADKKDSTKRGFFS